jgi:hypothetical protein
MLSRNKRFLQLTASHLPSDVAQGRDNGSRDATVIPADNDQAYDDNNITRIWTAETIVICMGK